MQFDQRIRQEVNRFRRRALGEAGADLEPTVTLEGDERPVPPRSEGLSVSGLWRGARFAAGFLATALLCGFALMALSAGASRIDPPRPAPAADRVAGGETAAAVDAFLAQSAFEPLTDAAFFWRAPRAARAAAFEAGVRDAIAAWAELEIESAGGVDPDLAAVATALSAEPADRRAARAALERRSRARLNSKHPSVVRPELYRALVREAEGALLAHVAMLAAEVERGRAGPLGPGQEAVFFRARGAAYGWRLILTTAAADLPGDARAATIPETAAALAALERTARFHPYFVLNGPPQAAFTPNHFAPLALRAAEAATDLKTLSAALEDARRRRDARG